MDTDKKYVRVNEIAAYLSLTPRTIRAYILQKKIPYIKRNGIVLFELGEIDRWMQAGRVAVLDPEQHSREANHV